jgi:hypothetical protein
MAGEPDIAFSQCRDERGDYWASAVTGDWQMIFREPGEDRGCSRDDRRRQRRTMLFNLVDDPLALHDLYGQGRPEEVQMAAVLDSTIERLEATAPLFRCGEGEIDPELLEQLRALGYIR